MQGVGLALSVTVTRSVTVTEPGPSLKVLPNTTGAQALWWVLPETPPTPGPHWYCPTRPACPQCPSCSPSVKAQPCPDSQSHSSPTEARGQHVGPEGSEATGSFLPGQS